MSDEKVRKLIGEKFAKLRKDAGFRYQGDLAERIGVDRSMISQIETGRRGIPEDRLADFARELGVAPIELTAKSLGFYVPEGYVDEPLDITAWRTMVILDQSVPWQVEMILIALAAPGLLDEEHWIVTVDKKKFVRETGRSQELVEEYWDQAMKSPYVEQIGGFDAGWVLNLKFPE